MKVLKVLRKAIRLIGLLDSVLDQLEREKIHEEALKASTREKLSKIYENTSNGPFTGK